LFLITANDSPLNYFAEPERTKRMIATMSKVTDLSSLGINIELLPIGQNFKLDSFYSNVKTISNEMPPMINIERDLVGRLIQKPLAKRHAFQVMFHIPGATISVKGYNLISAAKKRPPVKLERQSNAEVSSKNVMVCAASTKILLPSEIGFYYSFGGERAVFSKEELESIKSIPPSLKLIGFKSKSSLKPKWNIKANTFIVPDESLVTGSSSLFAHLHSRMLALDKIAICSLVARSSSIPHIVALIPQSFEEDINGEHMYGFHAIYLPFANDLRHVPTVVPDTPDKAAVDCAIEMIKSLGISNLSWNNPSLAKHYSTLEALALNLLDAANVEDNTMPNPTLFENAAVQIDNFINVK
jgi:ATP-dependent DNA helicase 2 subunit 1